MTTFRFLCSECKQAYDPASFIWRCPCGGLLDLADFPVSFPLAEITRRGATLWRYREALPFDEAYTGWRAVTMGEGLTPLVPLGKDGSNVSFKLNYLTPTISFKDLGAAVLIAKAQELGVAHVVADSSGNAGTAIAAYAARAGITCDIYVPGSTSPKKIKQIAAHGAMVHPVPGTREDTARAAITVVEQDNRYYASHIYNPFFYQGTKTYAFEIWEQLGWRAPDVLVLPVGNGTLILGPYYGFQELLRVGLIEKMPRFLAVQASACAPLSQAFQRGDEVALPVVNTGTEAEGIAIAAPARSRQILAAMRATQGSIISVPDTAIEEARHQLAAQGFYVEPTAAVAYAGWRACLDPLHTMYKADQRLASIVHEIADRNAQVIIPLCGAGLKAA
ncbi:MAG: threonine synthase [Ktedonobacteraceae bacterium]